MTLKGYNKYLLKRLNILIKKYGEPYDISGGFHIEDEFWKLLNTDSQKVKNNIIKSLLQYFYDRGYNGKHGKRISFEDDVYANTIFLECGVKGI